MYCGECGKEIADDSEFCAFRGAATGAGAAGVGQAARPPAAPGPPPPAPPPPPPAEMPPAPPAAAPMQPMHYAPQAKRSALPWVLGGVGLVVVAAVVLVLVLVVFKGGGADTSGAEEVVRNFFRALEKRDADLLLETMEPGFVDQLEEILGKDYRDFVEEYFFMLFPEDLEFTIEKMQTEIKGDKAEVTIVEGSVTYMDENGKKVTETASKSDMEALELVKVDGKWYLSAETLEEMGFDLSELEGVDLERNFRAIDYGKS